MRFRKAVNRKLGEVTGYMNLISEWGTEMYLQDGALA